MNEPDINVSEEQEHFNGGAVRDSAKDKPRPDLISPFFLNRLGKHLAKGAEHYGEWNWAKGIPNSRCFASCMRHITQYAMGETGEDHLAAVAFNIMVMIHNEEMQKQDLPAGLVDLPLFLGTGYDTRPVDSEKLDEDHDNYKTVQALQDSIDRLRKEAEKTPYEEALTELFSLDELEGALMGILEAIHTKGVSNKGRNNRSKPKK